MRHVGDGRQDRVQVALDLLELLLQPGDLFAQTLALGDQLLLLGGVLLLGDELGDLVLALLNHLRLLDRAACVRRRVATTRSTSALTLRLRQLALDGIEVFANEGGVQHGRTRLGKKRRSESAANSVVWGDFTSLSANEQPRGPTQGQTVLTAMRSLFISSAP